MTACHVLAGRRPGPLRPRARRHHPRGRLGAGRRRPAPPSTAGADGAARGRPLEATGTAVEPLPAVMPAVGRRRAGRRPAAAARPHGRGRHRAGPARAGRRALRRRRRARLGALAWTRPRPRTSSRPTGIPQVPWLALRDTEVDVDAAAVGRGRRSSAYPLFVKPANLGSSVGVSQGARPRRARRRPSALAAQLRRVGRGRGGRRRPRDRGGRARQRRPPGVGAGRDRPRRTSSTTTRTSTSTARAELLIPADLPAEVAEDVPAPGRAGLPGAAVRGHGPRRLLLRGGRPRACCSTRSTRSRASRPISMYPKLWEATGLPYDRAHRRAGAPGPRAPRAPDQDPSDQPHLPRGAPGELRGPPTAWTRRRSETMASLDLATPPRTRDSRASW